MIQFHSKAGADVLMLQAHADKVLQALGRAPAASGIFLPEQVAEALQAFERSASEAAAAEAQTETEADEDLPDLRRRAWPLLQLLRDAQAMQVPVVWSSN